MALNTSRELAKVGGDNKRMFTESNFVNVSVDKNLRALSDDPRIDKHTNVKAVKRSGGGRNTESFDPKSTLIRPDMRVLITPIQTVLNQEIKHDDVIIVPNFFCKHDDWEIYYSLVEEMRVAQAAQVAKSEWISWHEGAHLISNNPNESKTFQEIQKKISTYFGINNLKVGTRFNWYRDSSDWKPFHHDSAAYNPGRARNQNITVGVSFGATRELSFLNAKNGTRIYFPQTNGMMFAFGRDVNINWKHGINALPEEEHDGKGRISIVLWGLSPMFKEEANSPGMLLDNSGGGGHNMHNGHGHNSSRNNSYRGGGGRGEGRGRGMGDVREKESNSGSFRGNSGCSEMNNSSLDSARDRNQPRDERQRRESSMADSGERRENRHQPQRHEGQERSGGGGGETRNTYQQGQSRDSHRRSRDNRDHNNRDNNRDNNREDRNRDRDTSRSGVGDRDRASSRDHDKSCRDRSRDRR